MVYKYRPVGESSKFPKSWNFEIQIILNLQDAYKNE